MLSIWLQASQNRTKTWPDIAHNRIDMDMWHGWETPSLAKENIGKHRKTMETTMEHNRLLRQNFTQPIIA